MCDHVWLREDPVSVADEKPPGWEYPSFREGRSEDPQAGVLGEPFLSPASGVCGYDAPVCFPWERPGVLKVGA